MIKKQLWNVALILAIITVSYNVVEGLVAVYFGVSDGSLSLFGFGLDSFIEVMSGIGICHMIIRIKMNDVESVDKYERTALIITGISFYILTVGLIGTVIYNVITSQNPETTLWGIIISSISIMAMIFLMLFKMNIGRKLKSDAVIADANCTKTCVYLSVILLFSSILYHIFQLSYIDSIGALGIAIFTFKEGKESFDKSKGKKCCCND